MVNVDNYFGPVVAGWSMLAPSEYLNKHNKLAGYVDTLAHLQTSGRRS